MRALSRYLLTVALLGLTLLFLAGCAHQPVPTTPDAPGFLAGLRDGFLIVISLIASIFTDVRVYAFPNSGGWYDLGFVLGAGGFLGGGGASAR
jgi:hypothetical protein